MATVPDRSTVPVSAVAVATVLIVWAAAVAALAASGALAMLSPRAVVVVVAAGVVGSSLAYFQSHRVRLGVERLDLRRLTAFHAWRIGAAVLFWRYGAAGALPPTFVHNAGWGDLIAGLAALAVVLLPMARWRYAAMHLFGMADFCTAVGTGLYFTLSDPASMGAIRELPLALIPMFGVGLSGATHIMAFDLLRRRAGLA